MMIIKMKSKEVQHKFVQRITHTHRATCYVRPCCCFHLLQLAKRSDTHAHTHTRTCCVIYARLPRLLQGMLTISWAGEDEREGGDARLEIMLRQKHYNKDRRHREHVKRRKRKQRQKAAARKTNFKVGDHTAQVH